MSEITPRIWQMLGHCLVEALVHAFGMGHDLVQRLAQLRFRIAGVIDRRIMAEGRWMPRYETFSIYRSPSPIFSKGKAA
jgi:hypothetical protein